MVVSDPECGWLDGNWRWGLEELRACLRALARSEALEAMKEKEFFKLRSSKINRAATHNHV